VFNAGGNIAPDPGKIVCSLHRSKTPRYFQKNELNGYKDFCKTARNEGMTPVVKILSESDKY
jgi:hypothetical protein